MTKDEFCKRWLETFAKDVNKEKLSKCILGYNYIWHVFSFELINKDEYLSGDAAKAAFEKAIKYSAKDNLPLAEVLNYFYSEETKPIDSTCDTAEKLEEFIEIYVVSKDFKWSYIKTHEDGCGLGPYYMELKD